MKTTYLVAPIGLLLAACSTTKSVELPLVYSPECQAHSLTFESYHDGQIDYEFKDDPDVDTAIHIVVTPANMRYRLHNDGRVTALSPYIDPPPITALDLAEMRSTFMRHNVTFVEYAGDGSYGMSFKDNPECSNVVHVVVMPDASRFRIWNNGATEKITDIDSGSFPFTNQVYAPAQ